MPHSKRKMPHSKAQIILILSISLVLLGAMIYGYNYFKTQNTAGFLSAPSSLSSSTSSCTGTKFSWSSVGSSIKYSVLYLTYGSGEKAASSTTNTYKTVTGFAPGVQYNWRVLACPSTTTSLASCSVSGYKSFTQRCTLTNLKATVTSCTSAQLTWTAPTGGGASGYYVAYSTSSSFPGSYPYTTTSTSYPISGLSANTVYYAKVAAYAIIGGKSFPGTSSTQQFVTTTCGSPTCNIRCVSCLTLQNEDCSYSYNYEGCRSSCSCSAGCIGCNRWRQADCREVDNAACWKLCPSPYYWPTTDTAVSTYFGEGGHRGIDIDGHVGDAVYAITTGTIMDSRTTCSSGTETGTSPSIGCEGCGAGAVGNCVKILHTDGMYSVYGHLSTVSVTSGTVLKGDTIGAIGNSGTSYGGHLHLEILSSTGGLLNPCDYLDKC